MGAGTKSTTSRLGVLATLVVASALSASGLLAGISYGKATGTTLPTEIQVFNAGRDSIHLYALKDGWGRKTGTLSAFREPVVDLDGVPIGRIRITCLSSARVAWQCTGVASLKAGSHTEQGSITYTGNFAGFNGETLAVTGGTGAYEDARGTVMLSIIDDRFARTFILLP
jgi:hypothetical protein